MSCVKAQTNLFSLPLFCCAPLHTSIYQSRQRGNVNIPQSIINKTRNPKHVRQRPPFCLRSFFSYIVHTWCRCTPRPFSSAANEREIVSATVDIRELMEFYIFFLRSIPCPRFRVWSRFRFDLPRTRIAILGRAIYSIEHRHGFELIAERVGVP